MEGGRDYGTRGERIKANMAAVRLVKRLQSAGRAYASKDEQEVLSKYVGWGGLKSVFDPSSSRKQDQDARKELESLLTREEFFEARQSVLNAHYTRPEVIEFMYSALGHFGFKGGDTLEPTFGVGNFIGAMPKDMADKSKVYGSELDPVSAAIGRYLYPDAELIQGGFQDAEFPMGKFDVVVGNPPFGDEAVTDRNMARRDISGMKIHNYVMAKSGMHLRPGGIMAMVVTHRFLDTPNPEARNHLAQNFKMLGAVRMPNDAFKDSAGTEVVTDIIFLQRLQKDEAPDMLAPWLNTNGTVLNSKEEPIRVNAYFANNPSLMLGEPSMEGTMYGDKEEFTLKARPGQDTWKELHGAISSHWGHLQGSFDPRDVDDLEDVFTLNRTDISVGGYVLEGSDIYMRVDDDEWGNPVFDKLSAEYQWTEKTLLGEARLERIRQMLALRDLTYNLIDAERFDRTEQIDVLRARLNEQYDTFVAKFGYINDAANASLMSDDIKIEFGLEVNYRKAITAARAKILGVDPEPAYAEKAEILKGRVFYPEKVITSADSVRDAYDISMSEFGRPNFPYIARLTRTGEEDAIQELSDLGLVFQDPETKEWVQEDLYLSGNVKLKYQIAQANPGFERNAEALKAVFPADVSADEIFVDMGQTWIPAEVYEEFLKFMGVRNPEVFCNDYMGQVNITNKPNVEANQHNYELSNTDYSVPQLFNMIANKRPVVAYDIIPPDSREVNKDRTKALTPIVKKFRAAFKSWIFADPERTQMLEDLYNATQNTHTPRRFNGNLLKTVGNSPAIEYRDHQRSAAWRMIQSKTTLLDHRVGAGKTFCAITGIMERKRLGLSRKQLVVVPNHLVGQWARDFQILYPGANVLAATAKDFEKKNRRRLFSRMATGTFDAIICGHSSLGFIPIEPETEREFIMEEVEHLEQAMFAADQAGDKRSVRTIANRIAKKMSKAQDLLTKVRDDVASFEEMGIDHLVVDESHEFKNLEYSTGMRSVVGMGTPKGSKRAFDLYAKIGIINKREGAVTFATGTPISNSLVEMYSILRYLNKDGLKSRRLDAFDGWAKHFASIDAVVEYTATNKLKERQVMGSFNNLDELLQLYREFADVVQGDDLKRIYAEQIRRKNEKFGTAEREEFPVPAIEGGERQLNIAPANDHQSEYMEYLVARAQQLEEDSDFDPSRDNHLWIMSDARKMALDIRLVDPLAPTYEGSKVDRSAKEIRRIYDKWNDDRGTQLVFCDLSTPLKNAEKDAEKFIKNSLIVAGLDKNPAVGRVLESLTWQEKWDYIKGKITKEVAELAEDEGDRSLVRQEKLANYLWAITPEDTASLLTADTGFSVYDGLKAALIDQGIPANEVRFIHEANTASQKEELFDQVRAGKVRVLIGSTKKMGAGTNVQDRVVALHHLDAPWRPSDVEQREGRVIRQGNLLYARDPEGFKVEVQAYSTANTFDAVMWQILSRKAGMLEQFRKGTRNVVNVEGDSASYAEFMAESTGNPIFREKFRLENDIEELESVERNVRAQRASAERMMTTAGPAMKSLVKEIREWKAIIASMGTVDKVIFNGKQYKLDIEKGKAKAMASYEAAEVAWEATKAKYVEDVEKWQSDVESGLYDVDGKPNKKAIQEAKPIKPVGAPVRPMLREVAAVSEFASLMLDVANKYKTAGGGHVATVYVGPTTLDFYKTFHGDKSYMTVEVDDHELFDRAARPEDLVLKFANPETLKARAERHLEDNQKFIKTKARNIRGSRVTLKNLTFDRAEELSEKRIRLDFISEEINRIEEELAATRNPDENQYIRADGARFPKYSGSGPRDSGPRQEPEDGPRFWS